MLNLHKLFHQLVEPACFLCRLNISDEDKQILTEARSDIRRCLRAGIPRLIREWKGKGEKVTPVFFTQGSWAYKTVNEPAQVPPQEIDLDDGVYLVMSILNEQPPSLACNMYFDIVETLLGELAKKKGWKIANPPKSTCVRLIVNGHCHVDVPLYAVPDSEYKRLEDEARKRGYVSLREAFSSPGADQWLSLQSDRVWLAIRGGDWKQSDPRIVYDWFVGQVGIHGKQFVRVCRYLKAWRDMHWDSGGPSSILLMVCASKSFKKSKGRDDLATMEVSRLLANQLAGDVFNPYINPVEQLNQMTDTERRGAVIRANALYAALKKAITDAPDSSTAIGCLVSVFGERFPRKEAWVKDVSPSQAVRSEPKKVVAAPAIQRVRAG